MSVLFNKKSKRRVLAMRVDQKMFDIFEAQAKLLDITPQMHTKRILMDKLLEQGFKYEDFLEV